MFTHVAVTAEMGFVGQQWGGGDHPCDDGVVVGENRPCSGDIGGAHTAAAVGGAFTAHVAGKLHAAGVPGSLCSPHGMQSLRYAACGPYVTFSPQPL